LALLKLLRDQAPEIRSILNKNNIYDREEAKILQALFVPPDKLDVGILADIARQIIASVPIAEKLEKKVIQRVVSIEEMIGNLSERINKTLKMSFKDFSGMKKEEKVNVIVSFLAMLELVKRGILSVTQHQDFADIEMESTKISTPTYS
jgi:chromatin segregation and condensation protein Rec8/ScpA/Scc1 (kleisin family)